MEKLKRYDLYLCSIESQAVYMAFDKPDQVNGVFFRISVIEKISIQIFI